MHDGWCVTDRQQANQGGRTQMLVNGVSAVQLDLVSAACESVVLGDDWTSHLQASGSTAPLPEDF